MASNSRLRSSGPEPFEACPDGGRCWHACPLLALPPEGKGLPCWRVHNASPFSDYGEDWTTEDKRLHGAD